MGWINVDYQMPEDDTEVLVWHGGEACKAQKTWEQGWHPDHWRVEGSRVEMEKIVWWRPLLEGPEDSSPLPLAEELLKSIISADPNVVDEHYISDLAVRDLYGKCKELVKSLGGRET